MLRWLTFFFIFSTGLIIAQEDNTVIITNPVSGIDFVSLHKKVDSIVSLGIKNEAFPSAQILVAKNGKLIYHKAFGYHTYDSIQVASIYDMYDLASVTKVLGPLPAIMKLVDEGKLDLDKPFSTYWNPWKSKKDKKDLSLREILAHQGGLQSYIVFLNKIIKKNGEPKKRFVRKIESKKFNKQAYDGLFINNRFQKKVNRIINRSKVSAEKKYRYSGLTFLIFPQLIEQLTGQNYEAYLQDNFYTPIGASSLSFKPKTKGYINKIVPTELDSLFRHSLTQGWVHDENAALLGGISGNAGLFGNAQDVAKMMQLYLNYGNFNGKQLIKENTLKEFIQVQYPENENRRGLGFDKPYLNNADLELADAYPAPETSALSFGHSGFTGTFAWADPENKMIYVFLSNRVYPSRSHRKLYELNIRPAIQQLFYQAIMKPEMAE
jgi:CubicO group peptidase (beta-lactamase class C family)